MTRLEELTLGLADEALTKADLRELESLLATEPEAATAHIQLLEVEAALRGRRTTLDLVGPTLARLRSELGVSVERAVMRQLETEPPPAWARARAATQQRSRRREEADQGVLARGKTASLPRRLRPPWNRHVVLAFAASVVLLLGLSAWYLSPTMGQPMLAGVKGVDVFIERGTAFFPGANGLVLQAADVLRLGTNASASIAFGAEKTRFDLSMGTELKLTSFSRGKRFVLQEGRIEVSVARQRPLQPMIFVTPQAEARVLGTTFTLMATTSATRLEVSEGKVKLTRKSDDTTVKVPAGYYAIAATNAELAALPATGRILREYWTNLPGDYYITFLTSHPDYPDHPSGREFLNRFESPSHWGTNYGARIRGYLHPPKTGDYTFWIAAGDGGELFLSPDDNYVNRQQIGNAGGGAPHEWTRLRKQQSSAITLVAGRKYYIEALHKQGKKDDHLAVAWQGPGREREVIAGEFLSPFKPHPKEKKR
jgi:ferric-dicitrate binding protein FerR (iron transport regulator)